MSYYDTSRYVQIYMDQIISDKDYFKNRPLGGVNDQSRRKAREEELVRYNSLNPVLKFNNYETKELVKVLKDIVMNLYTTFSVSVILLSSISVVLIVCSMIFILPLIRKMTRFTIVMFSFEVDIVNNERERFKLLIGHYSKVVKCEASETIQNLEFSFRQSTIKSNNKSLAKRFTENPGYSSSNRLRQLNVQNQRRPNQQQGSSSGKSRISRERRDRSRQVSGFTFSFKHIIVTMTTVLLLTVLYSALRYLVLSKQVEEAAYVCDVIGDTVNIYVNLLSLNVAIIQLVAYDNKVPVEGMAADDFVHKAIGELETYYDDLIRQSKKSRGVASAELNEELNSNICTIATQLSISESGIPNCRFGMSGVANKSMKRFFPQYFNLAQQLVLDWSNTNSQEERVDLLRNSQYSSMIFFQTYNSLGFVDEFYYTIMMPTVTHLLEELDTIEPAVNLINIVSALFIAIMLPIGIQTAYFAMDRSLRNFWSMVYVIPIQLIDSNSRLKQRLKDAHQKGNFATI